MLSQNSLAIENCFIRQINTDVGGGILYANLKNQMKVTNCSFSDVTSSLDYSFCHLTQENLISLLNSKLLNFSSNDKGAISLDNKNEIKVEFVNTPVCLESL